jgi:hypothetical protein
VRKVDVSLENVSFLFQDHALPNLLAIYPLAEEDHQYVVQYAVHHLDQMAIPDVVVLYLGTTN